MELNKLKTFYTLAQTRNYTHCARKLLVTQSAVSHAVKSLETSLEVCLIDRTNRSFCLTGEGEALFNTCEKIFFELERTREDLQRARNFPEVVRLGSPVEFGISFLIKHMKPFFDRHPHIHVDFHLSHHLLSPLLNGELDLIIDCRPHRHPDIDVVPLFREEYVVIASADYIATNDLRDIGDLERCNILSLDKELLWWNNFIQVLPPAQRAVFNRVTAINHVRGIINAVKCALGVGFVPKYTVLREIAEGSLIALFPELDILNDRIDIYVRKKRAALSKIMLLTDFLKRLSLQCELN